MSSRAWTREEIEKFATEKQRNTRRRGRLVRFGNGSFDPSYRNVHFGTMVKTRLLSLCFSDEPFQIYFSSFFHLLFAPLTSARDTSLHFVSDLPDLDSRTWKEARRVVFSSTGRINCNTLRIGLIDRSRERERGEISRTKKGREERRGEIARGKRYRVVFIA